MSHRHSDDDWRPRDIACLEPAAESAIRSGASALVIAGPGAGKTELLAQKACFLLETGRCAGHKRILAISFKRDAAKNLLERVALRAGRKLASRFDSWTFDAFAKGIVDQFRGTLPPSVRPSADYEVLTKPLETKELEELLLQVTPNGNDLRAFAERSFIDKDVPYAPLFDEPQSLRSFAARRVWEALAVNGHPNRLTFRMLTRLATEIIRRSDVARRALLSSYSHVFIDEFQDTTDLQYSLTKALFQNTTAVVTAVGDPRQRIMGWAHALQAVFESFEKDFAASRYQLVNNHRASAAIKPVVLYVSDNLATAASVERTGSNTTAEQEPSTGCSIHLFADDKSEAAWVANEIEALCSKGTAPRDVAILARQKVTEFSPVLIAALATRGITARLEDIHQDLLAEPVVQVALATINALGAPQPRSQWGDLRQKLGESCGLSHSDQREWVRLDRRLSACRAEFVEANATVPTDPQTTKSILKKFVEPWLEPVIRSHGRYRQGTFYETLLDGLSALLSDPQTPRAWDMAVTALLGVDTVPILTVHKSKGLEYDAVFFVGLEDSAFWSFKNNALEEANTLFVGLSRARNRIAFTFAQRRDRARYPQQSISDIMPLVQLVTNAGGHVVDHRSTPVGATG
jgi:DNA helicase-2/ATP-dependent DNA helicase PcrA